MEDKMPAPKHGGGGGVEEDSNDLGKQSNSGASADGEIPAPGHDGDLRRDAYKEEEPGLSSEGLAIPGRGGGLEEEKSEEKDPFADGPATPGHGDDQEQEQTDEPGTYVRLQVVTG